MTVLMRVDLEMESAPMRKPQPAESEKNEMSAGNAVNEHQPRMDANKREAEKETADERGYAQMFFWETVPDSHQPPAPSVPLRLCVLA